MDLIMRAGRFGGRESRDRQPACSLQDREQLRPRGSGVSDHACAPRTRPTAQAASH